MRKNFIIISILLGFSHWTFAQDANQKDIQNIRQGEIHFLGNVKTSSYKSEFNVGGRLNTNGWAVYFELEKRRNDSVRQIFQFEVGETKHPKENKNARDHLYREPGTNYVRRSSGRRFVYGKKNVFYQVRLGYGRRRTIGTKGNKNGVEVSAIYMGGITLGLLKPYYLELLDESGNSTYYAKYSPETAVDFLTLGNIVEGGGFKRGWKEVTVDPGLYARLGMRFDWAEYNKFVSALEVGLTGTYYSKEAQIMVKNEGKNFFYGAYISLLFGKRW